MKSHCQCISSPNNSMPRSHFPILCLPFHGPYPLPAFLPNSCSLCPLGSLPCQTPAFQFHSKTLPHPPAPLTSSPPCICLVPLTSDLRSFSSMAPAPCLLYSATSLLFLPDLHPPYPPPPTAPPSCPPPCPLTSSPASMCRAALTSNLSPTRLTQVLGSQLWFSMEYSGHKPCVVSLGAPAGYCDCWRADEDELLLLPLLLLGFMSWSGTTSLPSSGSKAKEERAHGCCQFFIEIP